MNEQLLQLVKQAVKDGITEAWWLSFALLLLVVVASSLIGYLLAYAKKKGENYATKEDSAEILRQVRNSTRVIEEIKARISQRSKFEEKVLLDSV